MADFRTHISFSSMLGCGYAGAGYLAGAPWETALVAGGLCGVSGMLPDLDSDTGIPLRESMAFAAAIVPALLLDRLHSLHMPHDQFVLLCAGLYIVIRFGVTKLIAGRTTHRGMFHSVPAALIFAGMAFLLCGSPNVNVRYYKAGGVLLGVMSHLLLDEIYSFQVKRGRIRIKRSFGTAIKFWSKNTYSNISTYAKLVIIMVLILYEPAVMAQLETSSPQIAGKLQELQERYVPSRAAEPSSSPSIGGAPPVTFEQPSQWPGDDTGLAGENALQRYRSTDSYFEPGANYFNPRIRSLPPSQPASPNRQPEPDRTIYDTARRLYERLRGPTEETRR